MNRTWALTIACSIALVAATAPVRAHAEPLSEVTQKTMEEVAKLAHAIRALNPRLDDKKYVEYALGVFRAAKRFDLDPHLLIAIAQQETGFREALPEGAAGEIGICQIRKNWVKHKKFAAELGNPTIADMRIPSKSFMMAAWILKDLQRSEREKSVPYWAYYNARRFENRFKYYLLVNRHLSVLKKDEAKMRAAARVLSASRDEDALPPKRAPSALVAPAESLKVADQAPRQAWRPDRNDPYNAPVIPD
jgi:soluble lytic murein transglycosylase-like protein